MQHSPKHSLEKIKEAVDAGRYCIVASAGDDAGSLGFSEDDVLQVVGSLYPGRNFYQQLTDKYSCIQDVYKTQYQDVPIYLKLRLNKRGEAVIISFKRDGSPEARYGQENG